MDLICFVVGEGHQVGGEAQDHVLEAGEPVDQGAGLGCQGAVFALWLSARPRASAPW
jgi:hypothetical protein